jgi:RNA polymerase primary sigma factor
MRKLQIKSSLTNSNQDSLNRYLVEISRYPLLSPEEEVLLIPKIRNGDQPALHKLVNSNLRFVISVAKMYQHQGIALSDLISEGNLGLIKAAQRFDESSGYKFVSFAVWWIRQAMIMAIASQNRMVRLPMNMVTGILDLWKLQRKLEQKLERLPTEKEIAEYSGKEEEKVKDYLFHSRPAVSLDTDPGEDEKPGLLGILKDDSFGLPEAAMEHHGLKQEIRLLMQQLPVRQRQILHMAYGLDGNLPMQIEEIADRFGLSRESIRQNRHMALTRLKATKSLQFMRQYL